MDLREYQITLTNKKKELEILENFLNNFKNSDDFKKIVIKDKLFHKEKDEKIFLYD